MRIHGMESRVDIFARLLGKKVSVNLSDKRTTWSLKEWKHNYPVPSDCPACLLTKICRVARGMCPI